MKIKSVKSPTFIVIMGGVISGFYIGITTTSIGKFLSSKLKTADHFFFHLFKNILTQKSAEYETNRF